MRPDPLLVVPRTAPQQDRLRAHPRPGDRSATPREQAGPTAGTPGGKLRERVRRSCRAAARRRPPEHVAQVKRLVFDPLSATQRRHLEAALTRIGATVRRESKEAERRPPGPTAEPSRSGGRGIGADACEDGTGPTGTSSATLTACSSSVPSSPC